MRTLATTFALAYLLSPSLAIAAPIVDDVLAFHWGHRRQGSVSIGWLDPAGIFDSEGRASFSGPSGFFDGRWQMDAFRTSEAPVHDPVTGTTLYRFSHALVDLTLFTPHGNWALGTLLVGAFQLDVDESPHVWGSSGRATAEILEGFLNAEAAALLGVGHHVIGGTFDFDTDLRETWPSTARGLHGNILGGDVQTVPEPATLSLLALAGIGYAVRKASKR